MAGTYTEARARAVRKYQREKQDIITIHVPRGDRDKYRALATEHSLSLRSFCVNALDLYAQELQKEQV